MTLPTTLILGPTGAVASATALAAHAAGVPIALGMRDPIKSTPDLPSTLPRVLADLSDPASLAAAATATQATQVFLYLDFDSQDGMRTALQALQDAGVVFVLFLSSYSLPEGATLADIGEERFISRAHMWVEENLGEVFGPGHYVCVRPAWFASNLLLWAGEVQAGEVKVAYPQAEWDWISRGDIGRVCGGILARGPGALGGRTVVPLCGPQLLSQEECLEMIAKAIGKEVKLTEVNEQGCVDSLVNLKGMPELMAKNVALALKTRVEGGDEDIQYNGAWYVEAKANIRKYGGGEPTTFTQWLEKNKNMFVE